MNATLVVHATHAVHTSRSADARSATQARGQRQVDPAVGDVGFDVETDARCASTMVVGPRTENIQRLIRVIPESLRC